MKSIRVLGVSSVAALMLGACGSDPPPPPQVPPPPPPVASVAPPVAAPVAFDDSSLMYLEEVEGEKSLAFARSHNTVSEGALTKEPGFKALQDRLLAIYSSKEKIPGPDAVNDKIRNFWTDGEHQRGLWRQTTLAEYRKAEPNWALILDIDALNKAENASFVFHGANCLYPAEKKCLVSLSPGGGDATIVREFDVDKKEFVKNGFTLPKGKHSTGWKDDNTIFVGTDFGPGSMTKSGYPRIIKEWKRGTELKDATQIHEVKEGDISAHCWRSFDHDHKRDFCSRGIDFFHNEMWFRDPSQPNAKLTKLEKPDDAIASIWDDEIVLRLRSDWTVTPTLPKKDAVVAPVTFKKGGLITMKFKGFMEGRRDFQSLFEPTKNSSLSYWNGTKTFLLTSVMTDVKSQVTIWKRPNATAPWVGTPFKESAGSIRVGAFDENKSDQAWLWLEDFTMPSTLELWNLQTGKREPMKKMPSFFEAKDLEVQQHFVTSKDGTKIPYFEVSKKGRSAAGATLLEAYGGFELSMTPGYRASVGAAWLEKGGTYVLANIRGGGEYGPEWHEAAQKHKRQNAYDDLIAVAEDLVKRNVTTSKTLGVLGGSNGGLLTSVMLTQRPDLFGAVVSKVPLTDMKRYHKLLAGASWMGEYGDPDNAEDWAALEKFSPLHNIKKDAAYPPMLFTTSTKDDRVHPGHARKMVSKLEAMGHKPLYYENIEGGHGGAADIKQRAYLDALVYTFLASKLGMK